MTTLPIVILAAMARNRVIGADGGMPWHLPSDLRRYRALTMGKPMIMGRKTLDAIGRVLDGRDTIVLSRTAGRILPGAIGASGPEEAVDLATEAAERRGAAEIMVVGGEEIFRLFIDRASRIELTIIDAEPAGDAFFPQLVGDWQTIAELPMARAAADTAPARYLTLQRAG